MYTRLPPQLPLPFEKFLDPHLQYIMSIYIAVDSYFTLLPEFTTRTAQEADHLAQFILESTLTKAWK